MDSCYLLGDIPKGCIWSQNLELQFSDAFYYRFVCCCSINGKLYQPLGKRENVQHHTPYLFLLVL